MGSHLRYWGIPGENDYRAGLVGNCDTSWFWSHHSSAVKTFFRKINHKSKTLWASFVLNLLTSRFILVVIPGMAHILNLSEKIFVLILLCLIADNMEKGWPSIHMIPKKRFVLQQTLPRRWYSLHIGENLFCLFIHGMSLSPDLWKAAERCFQNHYSTHWSSLPRIFSLQNIRHGGILKSKCKYGIAFVL